MKPSDLTNETAASFEEAASQLFNGVNFARPADKQKALAAVAKLLKIISERNRRDQESIDNAMKSWKEFIESAIANTYVRTADEPHLKHLCRLIGIPEPQTRRKS